MNRTEVCELYAKVSVSEPFDRAGMELVEAERKAFLAPYAWLFNPARPLDCSIGPGWWGAVEVAFQQMLTLQQAYPGFRVTVLQVKEKFGGLRLYCRAGHENNDPKVRRLDEAAWEASGNVDAPEALILQLRAIMAEAERTCSALCEWCGEPGKRTDTAWIQTLCDKHAAQKVQNDRKRFGD